MKITKERRIQLLSNIAEFYLIGRVYFKKHIYEVSRINIVLTDAEFNYLLNSGYIKQFSKNKTGTIRQYQIGIKGKTLLDKLLGKKSKYRNISELPNKTQVKLVCDSFGKYKPARLLEKFINDNFKMSDEAYKEVIKRIYETAISRQSKT